MKNVPHGQQGSALMFVMIIGTVISVGFALLMSSTVLTEQRAVEADVARVRIYWAEMGEFNYAMSRISNSSLCNTTCGTNVPDATLAPVLQAYLTEVSNLTWTYPDKSPNYSFTIGNTAAPDNTTGRQADSGWLMASSSYSASALLTSSASNLPLMELRLCVGLNLNGKCGKINGNNGGKTTQYFSVNRLTNLPGR